MGCPRAPTARGRVTSRGLRRARKTTGPRPSEAKGQGSASRDSQIAGVYIKSKETPASSPNATIPQARSKHQFASNPPSHTRTSRVCRRVFSRVGRVSSTSRLALLCWVVALRSARGLRWFGCLVAVRTEQRRRPTEDKGAMRARSCWCGGSIAHVSLSECVSAASCQTKEEEKRRDLKHPAQKRTTACQLNEPGRSRPNKRAAERRCTSGPRMSATHHLRSLG